MIGPFHNVVLEVGVSSANAQTERRCEQIVAALRKRGRDVAGDLPTWSVTYSGFATPDDALKVLHMELNRLAADWPEYLAGSASVEHDSSATQ